MRSDQDAFSLTIRLLQHARQQVRRAGVCGWLPKTFLQQDAPLLGVPSFIHTRQQMHPAQVQPVVIAMLYTAMLHGFQNPLCGLFSARLAASGVLEWMFADLSGTQSAVLGIEQVAWENCACASHAAFACLDVNVSCYACR